MTDPLNYKVLDHGYVKFIEGWGSDARIIEAARMSTDGAFRGWDPENVYSCPVCGYSCVLQSVPQEPWFCPAAHEPTKLQLDEEKTHQGDAKLLRFLWKNQHYSPFEMGGLVIEVQAPIMVFREWHRHRTQSYNELSARYTPLPDVNYIPSAERCLMVSAKNRQAGRIKGSDELTHEQAIRWLEMLEEVYFHAQNVYKVGLSIGIPKELARLPVPVGRYSRMRASANLRNWLGFLSLRLPENAQWEIRQFSAAVAVLVAQRFPRTYELFAEQLKQ